MTSYGIFTRYTFVYINISAIIVQTTETFMEHENIDIDTALNSLFENSLLYILCLL